MSWGLESMVSLSARFSGGSRGFCSSSSSYASSSTSTEDATGKNSNTNSKLPFTNKTILVTGATRGIGRAIAQRFGELGGRLILVGRNREGLEGVGREMMKERGGKGRGEGEGDWMVVCGDVGEREFWEGEFGRGKRVSGGNGNPNPNPKPKIDILINAAGLTHASPLITTSPSLIENVLQTNLMGTIWGCKIIGKEMLRRREGCIINISSLLGIKGGRGSAAYAASLTRALAAEMGSAGIRVNAIVPGYIETDMTRAMSDPARSEALNSIPLSRFGDVAEIADAAVFLATNKYANNCVLNLDGGLSAV
ncbi:putative 2-deoxy-d-gluconate 3-dehydrogenase protein [Botrytis fragariae]|uniref:Putative 2-deoxy-d-gluconate 3-dehydrogenase protein n=1 Tax=Botrytis fragariae TaxID=1964551 RepID=A0A8H6ANR1_9HELO|nr:putative 2-deoxy-d-gluconate 3-dehydrogenase protein [Botrytis fragariae]KAF5870595.1 putative 2-deoxy-d-gluconate 3-dehydrogenase protein [Botrytis fragariae]